MPKRKYDSEEEEIGQSEEEEVAPRPKKAKKVPAKKRKDGSEDEQAAKKGKKAKKARQRPFSLIRAFVAGVLTPWRRAACRLRVPTRMPLGILLLILLME